MTEGSDPTSELQRIEPPSSTIVLETVERSRRSPVVTLTFLAVAAGAFLLGIGFASIVRDAPTGTVLASEEVGRGGSTLRFDGGEIRVPAGALATPARLVVRRTVVPRRVQVRPPGAPVQIFRPRELSAYIFEPVDIEFLRPVTILFRLREPSGGAATFARVGETTLLLSGKFDADRRAVSLEVSDFRFDTGQPTGRGG